MDDDEQWTLDRLAMEAIRQEVERHMESVNFDDVLNACTEPVLDEITDETWNKVLDLIETAVVVVTVGWKEVVTHGGYEAA